MRVSLAAASAALAISIALSACAVRKVSEARPQVDRGLARTLVQLGEDALARGDLDAAEERLRRALNSDPESVGARVGLGNLALARERDAEARELFDEALARDPDSADALLGAAAVAQRGGDRARARRLLERARSAELERYDVHAALAALTGRAPPSTDRSARARAARAAEYPYDPVAAFQAGKALAREGERAAAVAQLRTAVWLSDLEPRAAFAALDLLAELDDEWRDLRAVGVHVYADEGLRADPGWRFRMRALFDRLSLFLKDVLRIRFIPVSLREFSTAGEPNDLAVMLEAFEAQAGVPRSGILAALTARAPPKRKGKRAHGYAEFLGRRLIVRLDRVDLGDRVLAHEILHLYGATHVVDEVASLMNPGGKSTEIDQPNTRIVQSLRERRFGTGGPAVDVFPHIDLTATTNAYLKALRVNLLFRRAGIQDVVKTLQRSRVEAAMLAKEVKVLDSHLGDVSQFVAQLLIADERPGPGLRLLETSARLYGVRTRRGRELLKQARQLRRELTTRGVP